MTDAEAPFRDSAISSSEMAYINNNEDGGDPEAAYEHAKDAELAESLAEKAGEEVGQQYDQEHTDKP